MSGGSVPYHLRQNKAVERGVFLETLLRVGRCTEAPIQSYRYIGFAGPFSEDFKLVHSQIGITEFLSIEYDEHVFLRQRWNSPLRGIEYRRASCEEFIDSYEPAKPSIIWLDYADPRDLEAQLNEVQSLISKVADFDVVKVTFNANSSTLGHNPKEPEKTTEKRIAKAQQRLGAFLPQGFDITPDDVDRKGFPLLVLKAAEISIKNGMQGKPDSRFQLLTAFTYQDSEHRMLTVTGIVLPDKRVKAFLRDSGIAKWSLATRRWAEPRTTPVDIAVPEMSLRERLFVDQQLPRRDAPRVLMRRLGFRLGGQVDEETINALRSYSLFYRYFPYFSKMVV